MLDSIVFEQQGMPSASIITDVFRKTGEAMARSWGLKNFRFLELPHPIANLTPAQLVAAGGAGRVLGAVRAQAPTTRFLPARLARYIAWSARPMASSAVSPAASWATPRSPILPR